jgi:hypothetical protein
MAQGSQYYKSITATSDAGAVAFVCSDATGVALTARYVRVSNDGSSSAVYFNFVTTSGATTGDYPLVATSTMSIEATDGTGYTGLSYTTTGNGASVACKVFALR